MVKRFKLKNGSTLEFTMDRDGKVDFKSLIEKLGDIYGNDMELAIQDEKLWEYLVIDILNKEKTQEEIIKRGEILLKLEKSKKEDGTIEDIEGVLKVLEKHNIITRVKGRIKVDYELAKRLIYFINKEARDELREIIKRERGEARDENEEKLQREIEERVERLNMKLLKRINSRTNTPVGLALYEFNNLETIEQVKDALILIENMLDLEFINSSIDVVRTAKNIVNTIKESSR
jgi:hypothetical protein